jgi:hypothetical protein
LKKISKSTGVKRKSSVKLALSKIRRKECDMIISSRPVIGNEHLDQIKIIMEENPGINISRLSVKLCELWDWRFPSGDPKDMSCRNLLRKLANQGEIALPESHRGARAHGNKLRTITNLEHDTSPIAGCLKDIMPVSIEIVDKEGIPEFESMLAQYHYIGFDRAIGQNMKYMARDNGGRPVALLLYGAAAWKCKGRDGHIGWNPRQRQENLQMITNNTRFLIPQWVRIPNLASYVLSKVSKRISADWQAKYGHPILCLETFVDEQYEGTCYRAANWAFVGKTAGRGRYDYYNQYALTVKSMYLYPLAKNYRKLLCSETSLAK